MHPINQPLQLRLKATMVSRRCPFAQKAWITLVEKQLNFDQKIVSLQDKPKHFKELYASIHPDPTAPAKFSIIIGESVTVTEACKPDR